LILYDSSYCQRDVNQGAPAWFASPTPVLCLFVDEAWMLLFIRSIHAAAMK
jgi:hypothetical protein